MAPDPGIFAEVGKWIEKLDVPVKVTAGAVNNYVYRLKYGNAMTISMAIMALYSGNPMAMMGLATMMSYGGGMGGGMGYGGMGGGMGYGGMGYGGMGGGPMGYGGMGYGGMSNGMGYGGMGYGGGGYGYGNSNSGSGGGYYQQTMSTVPLTGAAAVATSVNPQVNAGLTGTFLGAPQGGQQNSSYPHVIPNPFDNTLLVQGTPQDWEQIKNLLHQLDVPPRQVLIDAKIYEVELKGAFSAGVSAYLDKKRYRADLAHPAGGHQCRWADSLRGCAGNAQPRASRCIEHLRTQQPFEDHIGAQHHRHRQHSSADERRRGCPRALLDRSGGHGQFLQLRVEPHDWRHAEHSGPREFERHRDHGDQPERQRAREHVHQHD